MQTQNPNDPKPWENIPLLVELTSCLLHYNTLCTLTGGSVGFQTSNVINKIEQMFTCECFERRSFRFYYHFLFKYVYGKLTDRVFPSYPIIS